MAGNVLSWGVALREGFNPRLYGYTPGEIPMGESDAVLDGKIWGKKVMGISCYFTERGTGRKFQLTVYCHRKGTYTVEGSEVDFSTCPIRRNYLLRIAMDARGRAKLERSILLPESRKDNF